MPCVWVRFMAKSVVSLAAPATNPNLSRASLTLPHHIRPGDRLGESPKENTPVLGLHPAQTSSGRTLGYLEPQRKQGQELRCETRHGEHSEGVGRVVLGSRKQDGITLPFYLPMTNLDSILKSRDITLPTKVHLVKAMVFPVVMYGCRSWTVKKAERRRIDAFELWCWKRLLRVPWTARRSNQSILNEISPGCSLERLRAGGEGDDRG